MRLYEINETRQRLEQFVTPLLALLGREERRRHGRFYVHGLLMADGRKNAAQMATRYGGDEQALQQFVSQSLWDWVPVRRAVAQQMAPLTPVDAARAIDDTGSLNRGNTRSASHASIRVRSTAWATVRWRSP